MVYLPNSVIFEEKQKMNDRFGSYFLKKMHLFLFYMIFVFSAISQETSTSRKFSFGKNKATKIAYTDSIGYGFDFNTIHQAILLKDSFIANSPVYFSIRLPEGNYQVELVLGSKKTASKTTLKSESRRLMLTDIVIAKNDELTKIITVNLRGSKINETTNIHLKDRELDDLNWDNKLTLEFLGMPAVKSIKITPIDQITTLFLAGDSTVTDQDLEPWASWGQYITSYFNSNVVIANYAYSGASLSSFKGGKRLEKILSLLKKGDYLLVEFGHNDEKQHGEGDGPWLNYTDLLSEFVTKTREKGGIPVLITPTQRRFFNNDGTLKPTHGDYPNAMRAVAKKLNVPLIDLTKMTTTLYESWGDTISRKAFVQYPAHTFPGQNEKLEDNTHFNSFGANEIALCIINGIKENHLDAAQNLAPNIPDYTPEEPNQFFEWNLPMSNRFETKKPDGN
tara:strand:+ start:52387 stop:53736 length:1350 start_codon:yes stop_codon:yes gene_type:complete